MIVGVPVETYPGERRVALIPAATATLAKMGLEVTVQQGAGVQAGYADAEYEQHGAQLVAERAKLLSTADVLVRLHSPHPESELGLLRPDQVVIGLLNPLGSAGQMKALAGKGVTAFALELVPRISRAQSMDALTSQASIAGYKAVLLAAEALDKIFPLMMTAAGTITPARVLVLGAGVAGLQAIATARRLGAVVYAYDIRPAVKEQVQSLGARFVEMQLETGQAEAAGGYARAMDEEFYRRQRELMAQIVAESDVVIATAAVPGKKAPVLITAPMVESMRPGGVIVDLAAETGGNCELTSAGERVHTQGVTIIGPTNLASTVPHHASQMYSRNITAFLQNLFKRGELTINTDDEIVRESLVTRGGEVVHPRVKELIEQSA
jgi:NAD(P) transhydrogenase subunit alpha